MAQGLPADPPEPVRAGLSDLAPSGRLEGVPPEAVAHFAAGLRRKRGERS